MLLRSIFLSIFTVIALTNACGQFVSKEERRSELNVENADAVIQELTERTQRPELETIDALPDEVKQAILSRAESSRLKIHELLFPMYGAVIETILEEFPDHRVVIMGRDCESFYNAFRAIFSAHENREQLFARLTLLPISRELTDYPGRGTSDEQFRRLNQYLLSNGIDANKIATGKEKVLFVDSWGRGNQLIMLMLAMAQHVNPEQWPTLLNHLKVRMLFAFSPNRDSLTETLQALENTPSEQRNRHTLENILVNHLLFRDVLSPEQWNQHGLNRTSLDDASIRLIMKNRDHWHGSAVALTEDGLQVAQFHHPEGGKIDRVNSLALQIRAANYFRSIADKFSSKIRGLKSLSSSRRK